MRHALGLDLPERRISLSAHDFAQALGAREVILSLSGQARGRADGGLALRAAARRGRRRNALGAGARARRDDISPGRARSIARRGQAHRQARAEAAARRAADRAVGHRDRELAARSLHDLRQARSRLRELDAVDLPPGAADRGIVIHGALGDFTKTFAARAAGRSRRRADRDRRAGISPRSRTIRRRARSGGRASSASRAGSPAGRRARRAERRARCTPKVAARSRSRSASACSRCAARADRIEQLADGGYAILDYKTGQPPTEKQVRIGMSPQLTLEAAILRGGGFRRHRGGCVGRRARLCRAQGRRAAGRRQADRVQGRRRRHSTPTARSASSQAWSRAFEDEQQPYLPLVLPMWKNRYGTYDHLARVKEWSVGEADDEDDDGHAGDGRMNAPRIIPDDRAAACRSTASDPAASAWVAANAGSGKTHVLAQRVIRLLLDGVDPASILCITFTKAAAANMANRVFDDAAPMDRARRRRRSTRRSARSRTCEPDATRAGAGAAAVRAGAGNAGRAQGADHPRVLHPAAASVSVRGRRRGALRRCSTRRPKRSFSTSTSLGVLLEAARRARMARSAARSRPRSAAAADQTFKDVVGEAIRKRDAGDARGSTHGGSVDAAVAELAATLGRRAPTTRSSRSTAEIDRWPAAAARRNGRPSPRPCSTGLEERSGAGGTACAPRCATAGAERAEHLSRHLLHRQTRSRASASSPRQCEDAIPSWPIASARSATACCALLERRKAVACRDRTAALLTIADAVISRYQAEKDRRGLLDYDDLIDKALALLARGSRGLGALQARPGHRPRADRRGAGHQPEAMGDRPAADGRILRRRRRARTSGARSSRSATRSNRSSRSRARRRASSTTMRAALREAVAAAIEPRSAVRASSSHSFRSGPERARRGRHGVRAAAGACAGSRPTRSGRCTSRCRTRRPAWSRSGTLVKPDRQARDRGLGCAVRRADGDQPAGPAGGEDRASMSSCWTDAGHARRRRAGAGAPARAAVRGDHPRAEGRRRRGRRRRPAGADRAYRGHGPDGARRRAAAAGRRSRAGDRAEEPAVRA